MSNSIAPKARPKKSQSTGTDRFFRTRIPVLALTIAFAIAACATQRVDLAPSTPDRETVVIFGFNDFHGALESGAPKMSSHIRNLRREFGDRLLVLHAGDEWQGTIESNSTFGKAVVETFNAMGVQASAVGNHEFDFGVSTMLDRFQEAKYPFLTSNIIETRTGKPPQWKNVFPSKIFELGRVRVGVLGLSTEATPVTTARKNVEGLGFESLVQHTKTEAAQLRAQGAQMVIALAHAGLMCDRRGPNPTQTPKYDVRTQDTLQSECRSEDEIVRLIDRLPAQTLDAVIAGHSHQIVHHWIKGVPVVQAGAHGKFFNLLYLTYDVHRGVSLPTLTRIEGPVATDQAEFHDMGISPDPRIEAILEPVRETVKEVKHRVVAQAARPVTHVRTQESEMGNLIADALRIESGADLSLVNPGGVRTGFDAGPIEYGEVYQVFPFDTRVSMLTVTGAELKRILRLAMSGMRGYFSVSGMRVKLIGIEYPAPSQDLDGDHKISPWEFNRLIEVWDANGQKIKDTKMYRLATSDFLVNGGDDLGWAMQQIPRDRIRIDTGDLVRDQFERHLQNLAKSQGPIHTLEHPLADPEHPRIVIAKKKGR